MMRSGWNWVVLLVACAAACALGGCSPEEKLADRSERLGGLWGVRLSSPAFENGDPIPQQYTQYGQNISPPLKWSAGPSGVKEWILIVEDADKKADKQGRPALHWMVYEIPGTVTELAEGAAGNGLPYPQGKNYLGQVTYAGPKPPKDSKPHRYYFQIFAVDTPQKLAPGLDRQQLMKKFKGHVLTTGEMVGVYPEPKEEK